MYDVRGGAAIAQPRLSFEYCFWFFLQRWQEGHDCAVAAPCHRDGLDHTTYLLKGSRVQARFFVHI